MSFLKPKTNISILVHVDGATAERMRPALEVLLNNLTADEIILLSRAVQQPVIKAMAFNELKKIL